jgi:Uma2 family endonuclease
MQDTLQPVDAGAPEPVEKPDTQFVLPSKFLPARLKLNPEMRMSDDDFYALCMANPDVWFERSSQGEIVIVPPAGGESSFRSGDAFAQLSQWTRRDRGGRAFDASAAFFLPTGAALSPDAAWVSNARLKTLSKTELRKFPHLTPEFVVEVMSPSDRLQAAREKMQEWIRAGVELAWLIHADEKTIYVYRAGQPEEKRTGITKISGAGPVEGFELDLTEIWAGL